MNYIKLLLMHLSKRMANIQKRKEKFQLKWVTSEHLILVSSQSSIAKLTNWKQYKPYGNLLAFNSENNL